MGMVYVFLYLPWIVTQPQILPQLLRNCWDVSLEIKVDWHADQSFMSSVEIAGSTLPNCMKKYQCSCFPGWEYVCLYLFLWPLQLITCRRQGNRNGCFSMGLENAYCRFCEVIIDTAGEGCDSQYFTPKTTQILLSIQKLNEANCWLDHKTVQKTRNPLRSSYSYCRNTSYSY